MAQRTDPGNAGTPSDVLTVAGGSLEPAAADSNPGIAGTSGVAGAALLPLPFARCAICDPFYPTARF